MKKISSPLFTIKTSIMLPLIIGVGLLISVFVYSYNHQENEHTQHYISEQFSLAKRALDSDIKADVEKLSTVLELIAADSAIKSAMMAGDRDILLQQSAPYFNLLRKKINITNFSFHTADRINFLRVHKPDLYGDRIDRFSALQAEATGELTSALEHSPSGLFILRVVFPWYEKEKLIGFVELGESIEHLYTHIKDISNVDLCIMMDKHSLSRKEWETGMKMSGRKADWSFMPESVVAFTTLQDSDMAILRHIIEHDDFKQTAISFSVHKHIYETNSLPLTKAGQADHEIGRMLFISDVSYIKQQAKDHILFSAKIGVVSSVLLLLFLYFLTRRAEKQLDGSSKELVESEERFRSLVESSSDWIWEVNELGHYTYSSPNVKDILGYEVDEVIGKSPFDLMPIGEVGRVAEEFSLAVKERKPLRGLENANRHKDGHIIILETSGVPIINDDGTLMGYRGIDRDITQRKHDEEKLQKLRERLMLHFQQTPLGVIEWNTDFKVAEWNPAAERIFGYTKVEALGRSAEELILTKAAIGHITEIWNALLTGQGGYRSTNENRTKEGKIIICEWYNTPLVGAHGRVVGVASVVEDITEYKHAEEKITHMAYYDALTELPNRTLFKDRLEQSCIKANRYKGLVGILFMDIDYFKNINDTLGHLVGDLLLIAVSARLKESVRSSDTVSRFGGDEFAVIISELENDDDVTHVIKSIFQKFKEPFRIQEHELFITLSIGSCIYPHDDSGIDNLLRDADTAMYLAKQLGRNQHQRYLKEMTDLVNTTVSIQNGLRSALKNDEFILYYQPQMDIQSGIVTGVEALIRWQHPEDGIKFPDEFIQVAEETGLIVPIGEWVLRTACKQAKEWHEKGLSNLTMAVNLSARQFKEEGFTQSVMDIVNESGVEANFIELELTESILADKTLVVGQTLADFKQAGIQISLDDFGTGYSSLSYLKLFPIDKLKIDQSFVRDIFVDKNDASLVKAIISMAKALGLKTIAEGVETEQQLDFLHNEGCEEMQGYFLAKPIPAQEIETLLKDRQV